MTFLLAILFEFMAFFSIWKPFPFQWHILGHWPCGFPSVWSNDCSFVLRFVHLFVCSFVCCVSFICSFFHLFCVYSWFIAPHGRHSSAVTQSTPEPILRRNFGLTEVKEPFSIIFQTHLRKYFLFQLIIVNITHLFQPFYAKYLLI